MALILLFGFGASPVTDRDPWTYDLDVSQGRIQPQNYTAVDGSYVMCLGSDLVPPPVHRLAIGDNTDVGQSVDLTGVDLVTATVRTRQPFGIPRQRSLQGTPEDIILEANTTLRDINGNYVASGVDAIIAPSGVLTQADLGQEVEVALAANGANNGVTRIIGVAAVAADAPLTAAIVEKTLIQEGPTGGMTTIKLGSFFRARILVDGAMRSEVVEVPGRTVDRLDMAAHVSKLSGFHVVKLAFDLIDERSLP